MDEEEEEEEALFVPITNSPPPRARTHRRPQPAPQQRGFFGLTDGPGPRSIRHGDLSNVGFVAADINDWACCALNEPLVPIVAGVYVSGSHNTDLLGAFSAAMSTRNSLVGSPFSLNSDCEECNAYPAPPTEKPDNFRVCGPSIMSTDHPLSAVDENTPPDSSGLATFGAFAPAGDNEAPGTPSLSGELPSLQTSN